MGIYQKIDNGNYMGEPTKKDAQKGQKKTIDLGKSFKTGSVAKGLPNQETDFPKNGRGPAWKMLRDSTSRKGSI